MLARSYRCSIFPKIVFEKLALCILKSEYAAMLMGVKSSQRPTDYVHRNYGFVAENRTMFFRILKLPSVEISRSIKVRASASCVVVMGSSLQLAK